VQLCAKKIIEQAKDRKMPLVIDGDGISSVVCVWPSLVEGYKVAHSAFTGATCPAEPEHCSVHHLNLKLNLALVCDDRRWC
jgi:hypothetical protein